MNLLAGVQAKIILALGLALAASLTGNWLQQKAIWTAEGVAQSEAITKPKIEKLEGRNSVLEKTVAVNAALQKEAAPQNAAILQRLDSIESQVEAGRADYRRAAKAKPLGDVCAPGQQRMDAVNRTLGAPQP